METITLSDIANYLPYGVKMCRLNKSNKRIIIEMNNGNIMYPIEQPEKCKLILRPLSDLSKAEWNKFCKENDFSLCTNGLWGSDLTIEGQTYHWGFKGNYNVLSKLFYNHFDINGLIDKGLALNINNYI